MRLWLNTVNTALDQSASFEKLLAAMARGLGVAPSKRSHCLFEKTMAAPQEASVAAIASVT